MHMLEQARQFKANGVTSIYLSAPKGDAAELFLSRAVLEGILAKKA